MEGWNQYLLPFPCKFTKPGLQVVDGPMRSIASGAERGGGGMEASRDYLGLEELDPSMKAKQTFRRRFSDYFL